MRWTISHVIIAVLLTVTPALPPGVVVAQTKPTADDHKTWMNDAADAQEDFRDAIVKKDGKAAVAALARIESLMARTETYWSARKSDAGVKLTKTTRAHALAGIAASKAGKLDEATDAFDKMNTACNACHELHLPSR